MFKFVVVCDVHIIFRSFLFFMISVCLFIIH